MPTDDCWGRRLAFPLDEDFCWLSNANGAAMKSYTHKQQNDFSMFYLFEHMNSQIHAYNNNNQRKVDSQLLVVMGHERGQKLAPGRGSREKSRRGVIKLYFNEKH